MRIAYIYAGEKPHPRRALCAKSVDADFHKIPIKDYSSPLAFPQGLMNSLVLALRLRNKPYDALLVDSSIGLECAYLAKKFGFKGKVIFYVAEPYFYNLHNMNIHRRRFYLEIAKSVDAYLAVSEMVKKEIQRYSKRPVYIAPSFSWRPLPKERAKQGFRPARFLYVANYRIEKGHKNLIEAWKNVYEKFPGSELVLIGKGTESIKNVPGIKSIGESDPGPYFKSCQFYIHPATYDPAPVSLIEAMQNGLIPITTTGVGNADLVDQIEKRLVMHKLDADSIERSISFVLSQKESTLRSWSKNARSIASKYDSKYGIDAFKRAMKHAI